MEETGQGAGRLQKEQARQAGERGGLSQCRGRRLARRSLMASADGESRVTAVSVEASGAGWGQTGRSLGRADIGLSWWEGLDCSGRKGQWRKTIRWRRWAGKWAGTGGKWTDRGGTGMGEDVGYRQGSIGTRCKRAGGQTKWWRQVEAAARRGVDGGGGSRDRGGGGWQRRRPR